MSNEKKNEKLGSCYSVARARLVKMILFDLLKKSKQNFCYRCTLEILNIDDLSIEHKVAWLNSDTPRELFFDLANISFSHLKCNSGHTTQPQNRPWVQGEKNPNAKVTNSQVEEIRASNLSSRELARLYNISHVQVLDIKNYRAYK